MGNLVLPMTKFNFSCRIEKKPSQRIGELQTFLSVLLQLEMPSPLPLLSLALLLLLPAIPSAQPGDILRLLTSGGFSLSSASWDPEG